MRVAVVYIYLTINDSRNLKKDTKRTLTQTQTLASQTANALHTWKLTEKSLTKCSLQLTCQRNYTVRLSISLKNLSFLLAITSDISLQSNIFIHLTATVAVCELVDEHINEHINERTNYHQSTNMTNKPVGDWISAPSPNFVTIAIRVGPTTFCMVPLNRTSPKTP